jgi:hypothetical protein
VPQKIKFTKQYKPMGFGDRDDKGSVEAHPRAKEDAREKRHYNRRMKEIKAEEAARRGLLSRLMRFLSSRWGDDVPSSSSKLLPVSQDLMICSMC